MIVQIREINERMISDHHFFASSFQSRMPSVLVLRAGCVVAHREIASLRIPSSSPECSPDTLALLHYSLFGKTHTLIFPRILSCTEYILRILLHYSLCSLAQNTPAPDTLALLHYSLAGKTLVLEKCAAHHKRPSMCVQY